MGGGHDNIALVDFGVNMELSVVVVSGISCMLLACLLYV